MANNLVNHYEENSSPEWSWFESLLAYDNGILPLALLHSAEILHDDRITRVAIDTMNFLTKQTLKENYLSIIGNEKWYKKMGNDLYLPSNRLMPWQWCSCTTRPIILPGTKNSWQSCILPSYGSWVRMTCV
jgi:hypothetical protein